MLPKWIYKNLEKYGNVALPNMESMSIKEMVAEITRETGYKITVRKCQLKFNDKINSPKARIRIIDYYVAERE